MLPLKRKKHTGRKRSSLAPFFLLALSGIIFLYSACKEPLKTEQVAVQGYADYLHRAISFEPEENTEDNGTRTNLHAHTGKHAILLDARHAYSPLFAISADSLKGSRFVLNRASFSAWIFPEQENPDIHLVFTISNKNDSTILWQSKHTSAGLFPAKTWTKLNASFKIEQALNEGDVLKFYVWNKGKNEVYVDDLFFSMGEYQINEEEDPAVVINYLSDSLVYNYVQRPLRTKKYFLHGAQLRISGAEEAYFVAGNFCADNADELLCVTADSLLLFQYCENSRQLKKTAAIARPTNLPPIPISAILKNGKSALVSSQKISVLTINQKHKCNSEITINPIEIGHTQAENAFRIKGAHNYCLPFSESNDAICFNNAQRPDLQIKSKDEFFRIAFYGYAADENPLYATQALFLPMRFHEKRQGVISLTLTPDGIVLFSLYETDEKP